MIFMQIKPKLRRKKIKDIRKELEAHILAEEYEMAAKLRDEIRTIEAQIARNN